MSVSTACFVFVKTSSRTVFANMSNHQSQDLPSNQQCCDNGPAPDGISPPPGFWLGHNSKEPLLQMTCIWQGRGGGAKQANETKAATNPELIIRNGRH